MQLNTGHEVSTVYTSNFRWLKFHNTLCYVQYKLISWLSNFISMKYLTEFYNYRIQIDNAPMYP